MKRDIKILYIIHSTIMSGAAISFLNMIRGLHQKGVLVFIVHPDECMDDQFRKESEPYVQKYFHVRMRFRIERNRSIKGIIKRFSGLNGIRFQKEIDLLSAIIEEVQPDIIHTNTGVIHSGFFAAQKANTPHVWHIREYQTKDFGWYIYPSKKQFIKYLKNSYVITITEELLRYFDLENYDKARCIYNGCFDRHDIATIFPKERYFLICSRISEEKGLEEVIRAFSIVKKSCDDIKLVIAGFGEENYVNYLRSLCKDLDCEKEVEFTGYQEDVRPLMDKATALIVASRCEAFGRMTPEAAFRSCFTIGKSSGGTKEIIERIGGFLYNGGAVELSERMTDILCLSEDEYKTRIKKTQNTAIELFSNNNYVDSVFSFYESIIGQGAH